MLMCFYVNVCNLFVMCCCSVRLFFFYFFDVDVVVGGIGEFSTTYFSTICGFSSVRYRRSVLEFKYFGLIVVVL